MAVIFLDFYFFRIIQLSRQLERKTDEENCATNESGIRPRPTWEDGNSPTVTDVFLNFRKRGATLTSHHLNFWLTTITNEWCELNVLKNENVGTLSKSGY